MRKKYLLVFLLALTVIVICIILPFGKNLTDSLIETTMVQSQDFYYRYNCRASVKGNPHIQYFNGNIILQNVRPYQQVNKGDVLLKYNDGYGKTKNLVSETDGYIEEIQAGYVVITDKQLYGQLYLPIEKFQMIKVNDEVIVEIEGDYYSTFVKQKNEYGIMDNGKIYYEIDIDLSQHVTKLLINQDIKVNLILEKQYGLTVDKRAVLSDGNGYYLLSEGFKEKMNDKDKYRHDIKVLGINDDTVLISGKQLDGLMVCIIPDQLKELLDD